MDAAEHRASAAERHHELAMAAISRQPRVQLPDIEVGQEARTKDWYVKSLHVPLTEGEGWKPWLERMGAMAALALEVLPAPANGGSE